MLFSVENAENTSQSEPVWDFTDEYTTFKSFLLLIGWGFKNLPRDTRWFSASPKFNAYVENRKESLNKILNSTGTRTSTQSLHYTSLYEAFVPKLLTKIGKVAELGNYLHQVQSLPQIEFLRPFQFQHEKKLEKFPRSTRSVRGNHSEKIQKPRAVLSNHGLKNYIHTV